MAAEFLQKAPNAKLDLAIAVFHSVSPAAGLAQLDEMPADQRAGDYFILRAQILDSMGKTAEAVDSLNRGIRAAPRRADMYFEAAAFLIQHGQFKQSAALLEDATRLIPDAPNLWLARAIALELPMAHGRSHADEVRSEEAMKVLAQIESRWPAWDLPYLVNGMILQDGLKSREAKQMLDLAIALGCREADAYYYEALAITNTTPVNLPEAQKAISQAVTKSESDDAPHEREFRIRPGYLVYGASPVHRATAERHRGFRINRVPRTLGWGSDEVRVVQRSSAAFPLGIPRSCHTLHSPGTPVRRNRDAAVRERA